MKFRLVETFIQENDLTSPALINELKQQFGNDFDSKPLCKEVCEYVISKFDGDLQGHFFNIIVMSREDGIISNQGHCVIMYNNKIYDYTSNQYSQYNGIDKINYCPRVLTYDEEMSNLFEMNCYSHDNYIIGI